VATGIGRRILATALLALVLPGALAAETLAELAAREKKRREAMRDAPAPLFTDQSLIGSWVGWRDFKPADGSFVVDLPASPSLERSEIALGGRFAPAQRLTYRATDTDGAEFAVTYTDYPSAWLDTNQSRPYDIFQSTASSERRWYDSFVLTQTNLSLHQAMLLRGTYMQVAGTLIGNRFYELKVVSGKNGLGSGPALHPFFRSFTAR